MMLTGYADVASIVRAVNEGRIYRYIPKPWEPAELRVNVRRALESYSLVTENASLAAALRDANERLRQENLYLRREVQRRYAFDNLIGSSPAMLRVFEVMEKVATTDATVLLTGETGTGKDLVARAIHYAGARKAARFVAQNCGALPDTLLESELFGHKRGAFTGAHEDKKGLFELAHDGTIFLDEIGETQSRHAGAPAARAAGRRSPAARRLRRAQGRRARDRRHQPRPRARWCAEGRFREDLYYRLRVVEIHAPAAARAARGHPGARPPLPRGRQQAHEPRHQGLHQRRDGPPRRAPLERQRARARERDRTHRRAGRRCGHDQRRHALRGGARPPAHSTTPAPAARTPRRSPT